MDHEGKNEAALADVRGVYVGLFMVVTEREADGRFIAEAPDLPGVLAYGETEEKARAAAIVLALRTCADRIERGEPVRGDVLRWCDKRWCDKLEAVATAAQERPCTHPPGCTFCPWCGFRAVPAADEDETSEPPVCATCEECRAEGGGLGCEEYEYPFNCLLAHELWSRGVQHERKRALALKAAQPAAAAAHGGRITYKLDMMSEAYPTGRRHPQELIREIAPAAVNHVPQSMFDCWTFECEPLADPPAYVKPMPAGWYWDEVSGEANRREEQRSRGALVLRAVDPAVSDGKGGLIHAMVDDWATEVHQIRERLLRSGLCGAQSPLLAIERPAIDRLMSDPLQVSCLVCALPARHDGLHGGFRKWIDSQTWKEG